jgi:hypothetical protein
MNWLKRNSANLWMVAIVVPLATWLSLQVLTAHAQKPESQQVCTPGLKCSGGTCYYDNCLPHESMTTVPDIPGIGKWIESHCRALRDGHIKCGEPSSEKKP